MTDSSIAFLLFWFVLGGFVIIGMALYSRHKMRELMMRERIAMIEKGLVPSPESDPGRFDRFDRIERLMAMRSRMNASGSRYRSLGVMMIGLGLAFVVLLTFAGGVPGAGLGVGGALMVLGAAMFLNGILVAHTHASDSDARDARDTAVPPQEPPANVAP